MTERGVAVDHSTIYRWVQHFTPKIEKRLCWHWRRPRSRSWRVDETYIKVRGKWAYLYHAVDKFAKPGQLRAHRGWKTGAIERGERLVAPQLRLLSQPGNALVVTVLALKGSQLGEVAHVRPALLRGPLFNLEGGIVGEARIVERAFGHGPCALTEVMALRQDRLACAES